MEDEEHTLIEGKLGKKGTQPLSREEKWSSRNRLQQWAREKAWHRNDDSLSKTFFLLYLAARMLLSFLCAFEGLSRKRMK